jgi:D-glycero-D-manno-heptose 1,7-bisphosphate phosphatase
MFQKLGFKIIVITNQSGIARGYYHKRDFDKLSAWMVSEFKQKKVDRPLCKNKETGVY